MPLQTTFIPDTITLVATLARPLQKGRNGFIFLSTVRFGVETEMLVKDVMTATLVKISPDNSVERAALTMLANHVSGILVVDDSGHLVGIISEGDLIRRTELGSGANASLADTALPHQDRARAYIKRNSWRVGNAMAANPVTIDGDASLARAAQLSTFHGLLREGTVRH